MNDAAEKRLLQETAHGDGDALRYLYDRLGQRVFRYIFRLVGDHQKAEDLTIDTFTEVWRSAGKFRGDALVSTWVIGIARNLTMSDLRRNRVPMEELDDSFSYDPDPLQICAGGEQERLVKEALWRLPVIHREVLDLVFMQEMNYEQIACIVSIPVNTVKTRVFHAKAKLREILENMGVNRDDVF
jgi:RNA polymerase sigma-70 factor (ECF subfamily)